MLYLFGFLCVCALSVVPLVGCSETAGDGGSGGSAGSGGTTGFPCTEEGINEAIIEGGGPHTFDCNGAQTVRTGATISVNNDVILDGQGNITVEPSQNEEHPVFWVHEGVTAELRGFTTTGGNAGDGGGIVNNGDLVIVDCSIRDNAAGDSGGGIMNSGTLTINDSTITGNTALVNGGGIENIGTLTLTDCTVSENNAEALGGGIRNSGNLTVTNSTISANSADAGGAITNGTVGVATMTNTTVSGNSTMSEQLESAAIDNFRGFGEAGSLTMVNCTVSGNTGGGIQPGGPVRLSSTIVSDDCREGDIGITSLGFNIESPGSTCAFDPDGTDRIDVTAEQLNLGELDDNGGPTQTHALGLLPTPSVAIDHIPEPECLDPEGKPLTTDQRGLQRPVAILGPEPKCDVGSFERQEGDQ